MLITPFENVTVLTISVSLRNTVTTDLALQEIQLRQVTSHLCESDSGAGCFCHSDLLSGSRQPECSLSLVTMKQALRYLCFDMAR